MTWTPYEDGQTIGGSGTESGRIIVDERHSLGARITVEEDANSAPFVITCGIDAWVARTAFASTRFGAEVCVDEMKSGLSEILALIPDEGAATDEGKAAVRRALETFAESF